MADPEKRKSVSAADDEALKAERLEAAKKKVCVWWNILVFSLVCGCLRGQY